MVLSLVEKIEDGKKVIDLNLPKEQVELGSPWECRRFEWRNGRLNQILNESNMLHLCQGFDSDVYKVGNQALKVYCGSGCMFGDISLSAKDIERYQRLTEDAKILLEQNPPEDFRVYHDKGRKFDVSYEVVPIEGVFGGIGENLREVIIGYFGTYTMGHRIRHVWKDSKIVASTQAFIFGNHISDSKNDLKAKMISPRGVNRFLARLWETFPDYNLVHFGMDLQNVKAQVNGSHINFVITDLAAKVYQQAGTFERGKRYD